MDAWDDARADALGIQNKAELPPTARGILMRLNSRGRARNWRQWLALATTAEPASIERHLISQQTGPAMKLSPNRVRYALRCVAEHLQVDALSPDDYARGRESVLGHDRRRRHGVRGALGELLPTVDQLQKHWDWSAALKAAGLKRPAVVPVRRSGAVHAGGLPHVDAQVVFARVNGRFAGRRELQLFMLDCDAALVDAPRGAGAYIPIYDEAEERLRAEGYTGPLPRPNPATPKPAPYELPPGGRIEGAPRSQKSILAEKTPEQRQADLRERSIAGLRAFLAWMADEHPTLKPTQERYRIWRKGTKWPSQSNFQQFGGFTVLLEEAREASPE